jgi:Zn-dependent alcohol dehydrogenase
LKGAEPIQTAVLYEAGNLLKMEDVTLGEPQASEILVKFVATGVCHPDLHFIKREVISSIIKL